MKKVIGIINNNIPIDNIEDINASRGGSETWLFQIAAEFAKNPDYHVIVFSNGCDWVFTDYGVEFVPMSLFEDRIQYQQFDHIIISRIYEGIISKIESANCCNNIVIQSHDWGLGYWWSDEYKYTHYNDASELHSPLLKKVIALSEWHVDSITEKVGYPRENIVIIPNGIDLTLFDDIDYESPRDNHVLWSSRPERGCDILTEIILPTVRQVLPDFEVDIASYDPIQDRFKDRDYINILGGLSKKDLYKEMSKHKVWFYASTYPETFNITLPEAIMCGNLPVLPLQHGMATTLKPFLPFGMTNKIYDQYWVTDGVWEEALVEASNMIINYCHNYDDVNLKKLRECMRNHIKANYTWKRVVELYEELWESFK